MNIRDLNKTYQYAMHGLGAYKGLRQTNTFEAFKYWYDNGVRVFEIDFARTADIQFVAVAHAMDDWSLHRLELFPLPPKEQRTETWFMQQKLFSVSTSGLTPFSLKSLIDILKEYKDCIFMVDLFGFFTKEETKQFVKALSQIIDRQVILWERLLLEAYNDEMVEGIFAGSNQANIIYCVRFERNLKHETTVTPQDLLSKGIRFISYPWYCTKYHPGELQSFSEAGIAVFSRTKYNTKNNLLRTAGVNVNIIANKFDGFKIFYQYPAYMLTYVKRLFVKLYLKTKM